MTVPRVYTEHGDSLEVTVVPDEEGVISLFDKHGLIAVVYAKEPVTFTSKPGCPEPRAHGLPKGLYSMACLLDNHKSCGLRATCECECHNDRGVIDRVLRRLR